jgi:hypothetical protein
MSRDELLHELNQIAGELRCAAKHLAFNRARNYRTIDPAAPSERNAEINAGLSECHADRLESNQLIAKRNRLLQELAQIGERP